MQIQDIPTEKLNLISWICALDDIEVIELLKSVKDKNPNIPDWQKKELDKRWKDHINNPDQALDFDEMMDEIDKELEE